MNFKDDLLSDMDDVFFNLEEFAEPLQIGEDTVMGILDSNLYEEKKYKLSEETKEVFQEGTTLFVKEKELLIMPRTGENLTINNIKYIVEKAQRTSTGYFPERKRDCFKSRRKRIRDHDYRPPEDPWPT